MDQEYSLNCMDRKLDALLIFVAFLLLVRIQLCMVVIITQLVYCIFNDASYPTNCVTSIFACFFFSSCRFKFRSWKCASFGTSYRLLFGRIRGAFRLFPRPNHAKR